MFLCSVGIASPIKGSGIKDLDPWTWTCTKGENSIPCTTYKSGPAPINSAECGNANNKGPFKDIIALKNAGLCVPGNVPDNDKDIIILNEGTSYAQWEWNCYGTDGSKTCSAKQGTPNPTPQCDAAGGSCIATASCTGTNLGVKDCGAGQKTCCKTTTCNHNNIINTGESCDGTNLNGKTCATQLGTGYTGTLACTSSCTFDTIGCTAPSPITTTLCSDYTNAQACAGDNDNYIQKGYSPENPIPDNGVCSKRLVDRCSWNNNICGLEIGAKINDVIEDINDCSGQPSEPGCSYDPQKTNDCESGGNFMTISYIPLDSGCPAKSDIKVSCSAKLPFFTWINIVLIITVLIVFYLIIELKRRANTNKKGKKRR
jgi:hypothetical protein